MRKLYATLILLAAAVAAYGQPVQKGITVENPVTEITAEDLDLSLGITASGLDIDCDGLLVLEFAVESDDRRLVLPPVVYVGGQRYRYESRRDVLSGNFRIEPYRIYKGIKKNRTYQTEYKLTIPYYAWMEHASVTWREYTRDCSGERLADSGVLVADLNPAPVYVEPEIWHPNASLFPNLVSFLVPEVEEVKARASMISLNIGFPVNVTEVRPAFGDNAKELQRADSLVSTLGRSELIDINGVNIRGYASPEGRYDVNERLARSRSQNFKKYLADKFPSNPYIRNAQTSWVPEDWEGFGHLIEGCDIPGKTDVLAIVNDPAIAPDTKDRMLQNIQWWSDNYKVILKELYPKLRRIELRVDYTVHNLTDAQARELLYTHPEMLSLEEIYRVARYYEPGSKQYREVYEIAARQYPDDVIANNNAAAALLQEGNAEAALPYLEKSGESGVSLINYGAYYYILEDLEKATDCFTKAKEAGVEQAGENLRLINPEIK